MPHVATAKCVVHGQAAAVEIRGAGHGQSSLSIRGWQCAPTWRLPVEGRKPAAVTKMHEGKRGTEVFMVSISSWNNIDCRSVTCCCDHVVCWHGCIFYLIRKERVEKAFLMIWFWEKGMSRKVHTCQIYSKHTVFVFWQFFQTVVLNTEILKRQ